MSDESNLVPRGIDHWLALLAALLGLAFPFAGAAAASASAFAGMASQARARRDERKFRRLQNLVENIHRRVSSLESQFSDEEVDVFIEVTTKALNDDEARKEFLYAGLLEWILRERPPRSQVRVLSDAVHELSFTEISYFLLRCDGRSARRFVERELSEDIADVRLSSFGIAAAGIVRVNGGATDLGKILTKYCSVHDLFRLFTPAESMSAI